jgi:hypothetical protein
MNQLALFASPNLRALVTTAEAQTQPRFWEFLAAQIRNKHTRRAYSAKHAICSRVRSALLPESTAPDASDLGNGCEESPASSPCSRHIADPPQAAAPARRLTPAKLPVSHDGTFNPNSAPEAGGFRGVTRGQRVWRVSF